MIPTVYADPSSTVHDGGPDHPERPERLQACLDALAGAGIVPVTDLPAASDTQLALAHEPQYLERMERFCARGGGSIDADTYARTESFAIARRASGAACAAVDDVVATGRQGFCLVRPPGHHATANRAMGFCLVNHVAVAAAHAIATGLASRVAIVDFDVHHGNGTQDIFWERPDVLYTSLHQFPWYPGTGRREEIGTGPGKGTTVNVPLPARTPDEVYLSALRRVVLPALDTFAPDLLLVSAGFDAHSADPLGSMLVSTGGFAAMTALLVGAGRDLCSGRVVLTLEGGYDLEALAACVLATLEAMDQPERFNTGGTGGAGGQAAEAGPQEPWEALERVVAFHRASGTI